MRAMSEYCFFGLRNITPVNFESTEHVCQLPTSSLLRRYALPETRLWIEEVHLVSVSCSHLIA